MANLRCSLRREVEEEEITLENVFDFPISILHEVLGDLYVIEGVDMDPRAYGFLVLFAISRFLRHHVEFWI